ncbi:MAG: SDR family oxidoreductase, partial [Myxococcales bacterium]|nr:SDR family oxidoreductase [Myxococcales bacterium]
MTHGNSASMSYDETILVTGYPSFRGRKMVDELLTSRSNSLIFVIVREKFAEEATQHREALPTAARQRLVMLDGDAAAMDLGLSGKEYRELAGKVQRIHHCAQVTYPGVGRQMANEVNLGAMREIIEFARCSSQLESVVVHSSAIVSGDRTGVVYEHELNAGQAFRGAVEQTLARAERIARGAMADLPICVIRPTQIVGDSSTGEVDRLDGPYMMMLLLLSSPSEVAIPLPTRGDTPLNLVPIDFVVRAAAHLGRQRAALGRTFHLA